MKFILAALALAFGAPQVSAQAKPETSAPAPQAEQFWAISGTRAALVPARIAFPLRIGTLEAYRTQEFSHEGEGVDNAIQYRSSDEQVFVTVYVYYPGLPHAGLAAFATDNFIRASEPATRISTPMRLVNAGGVEGAAIRIDYANYRGMASSAAFLKAGRWIVKFRASGPEARRAEVEGALAALLRDVQFGAANPSMAPHPLTVADCPAGAGQTQAHMLPDPPGAELAAHGLLATFDGGGNAATDQGSHARRDLPPRIPDRLCLSHIRIGERDLPLLRGEAGEALSVDGRTRVLLPLNDAGVALEVVHAANLHRYLVLYHEIGATSLLGGYDGVPSDSQLAEILAGGGSEANRIRVPVRFRPNQGPEMALPPVSQPAPQTGTD